MKEFLRRREFVTGSLLGLLGLAATKSIKVQAADAAKITEKDIVKEGAPMPAHYCVKPSPTSKVCPDYKDRPGNCSTCQFYQVETKATFKGKEYAKCQIVPQSPNYVASTSWCSTYTKKAGA